LNSLLVAAHVVVPLLVLIAIGYMAGALRWISNESFMQMNRLVFNILLPCVLFDNVYSVSLSSVVNPSMLLFSVCAVLAVFACGIPVSGLLTRDPKKRGVALQSIFRSNFVLYGFPIVQSLYTRAQSGSVVILIAAIVPVFNVLAVMALVMFNKEKTGAAQIAFKIIKNPLIIAAALGIVCSASGFVMPVIVSRSLSNLTAAATPVALIVLGGTFRRQSVGQNKNLLISLASLRLLIVPAVCLTFAIILGFRNVELLGFVALFGSPVAVSSFSMAQQMDADSELAGQNLLFNTVFSILTIFMWVSALNYFQLIV